MTNIPSKRDLYGLPDHIRYLNNAFMSPMSNRVREAGERAIASLQNPSFLTADDFFEPANRVRGLFAQIIGTASEESVAIVPSASYGMAIVRSNVVVKPKQNIVVVGEQFPSNVYAWRRLSTERRATLRTVAPPIDGAVRGSSWNASVLDAIDIDTAIVSMANVHWSDGTVFDLISVGKRCREVGAVFVVDGTQSVGALPFSVGDTGVDALICSGYKALTGPYGIGLCYFGPRFHDGIPIEDNWSTRLGSEVFSRLVEYEDVYQPRAKRFDSGEYSSFTLLPMLTAALEQVIEWTPEAIQGYCRFLTSRLAEAARSLGYEVEEDAYRAGHLMGIRMPAGIETDRVRSRLQERNIFVSIRGKALRVAPHVYSRTEDVDALVDVLRECIQ